MIDIEKALIQVETTTGITPSKARGIQTNIHRIHDDETGTGTNPILVEVTEIGLTQDEMTGTETGIDPHQLKETVVIIRQTPGSEAAIENDRIPALGSETETDLTHIGRTQRTDPFLTTKEMYHTHKGKGRDLILATRRTVFLTHRGSQ